VENGEESSVQRSNQTPPEVGAVAKGFYSIGQASLPPTAEKEPLARPPTSSALSREEQQANTREQIPLEGEKRTKLQLEGGGFGQTVAREKLSQQVQVKSDALQSTTCGKHDVKRNDESVTSRPNGHGVQKANGAQAQARQEQRSTSHSSVMQGHAREKPQMPTVAMESGQSARQQQHAVPQRQQQQATSQQHHPQPQPMQGHLTRSAYERVSSRPISPAPPRPKSAMERMAPSPSPMRGTPSPTPHVPIQHHQWPSHARRQQQGMRHRSASPASLMARQQQLYYRPHIPENVSVELEFIGRIQFERFLSRASATERIGSVV